MANATNYAGIFNRILFFIAFFIYVEISNSSSDAMSKNVCSTEECEKSAMRIKKTMDPSVSPCDNFYQFVCGKFAEDIILSNDTLFTSVITQMEVSIPSLIESYLDKNSLENLNDPYRKAYKLYELCKNRDAVSGQEVTNLHQIIQEFGGWPVIKGELWKEQRWEDVTGQLSQLGVDPGIFFNVQIQNRTSKTNFVIELNAKRFPILSPMSQDRLWKIAIEMGANVQTENLQFIHSIVIVNHLNNRSTENDHYSYFTIEEMMTKWPSIDWMTYLTGSFSILPMITIDRHQRVFANHEYIDDIVTFIKNNTKSTIMNYVVANFIEGYFRFLRYKFPMDSNLDLNQKSINASSASRRKYCTQFVSEELPEMVDAIFWANHIDDQLQNEMDSMMNSLKNQMDELLKQAHWLDNQTMQNFVEQLFNLTMEIGYEDALKNNKYIEKYNDLELDERSFPRSILSLARFERMNRHKKSIDGFSFVETSSVVENTFGIMPMISVNSAYFLDWNKIVVSPGLLQEPFINNQLPKYINYGGIGSIIAHELAHSLSDVERSLVYNKVGNISSETSNKFLDKINCYINQYNNYTIAELNSTMNGETTVFENIADDIGVKLVHLVYKSWEAQAGLVLTLPNLNYTSMQMFWISYAKNRCTKYNPLFLDYLRKVDSHSLQEFRTNGPLSKYREFSEAFHCPLGSHMNPVNKCLLL